MPKPDQNMKAAAAIVTAEDRLVWLVPYQARLGVTGIRGAAQDADAALKEYRERFSPVRPDGSFLEPL